MRNETAPARHHATARALRIAGWLGLAGIAFFAASPIPAGETRHLLPQALFLVAVFATGALLGRWSPAARILSAGVALGWVAWRPEALLDWNFALPPARLAEGAMLALACDRLLAFGAGLGATPARRRIVRAAGALTVTAIAVLAATGGLAPRDRDHQRSRYAERTRLMNEVLGRLACNSAATEHTFISAADLARRYEGRLREAHYSCDSASPCLPYYRLMRDMLAELNDGHTDVDIPGEITEPDVGIEPIGGAPVITAWIASPELNAAGLRRGLIVETVDGHTVRETLADRPAWLLSSASEHGRVASAYRYLLTGPPGSEVRLGVRDPGGRAREIALRRPVYADTVGGGAVPEPAELTRESCTEEDAVEIVAPGSADAPAVVRIEGFGGPTLHSRFARALHSLDREAGLVLDIRDNPGGRAANALAVAGHFFRHAWKAGAWVRFDRTKPPTEDRSENDILVVPILPIFEGPVAVLTDHDTASAGDLFAYSLCRSGRARCFGRTTAGELNSVNRWRLDGVTVGLADAAVRPSLPGPLHGFGVVPDEPVERTLRDIVSGRDADLDAATRWLATQRGRTGLAWRTDLPRPVDGKDGDRERGAGDSVWGDHSVGGASRPAFSECGARAPRVLSPDPHVPRTQARSACATRTTKHPHHLERSQPWTSTTASRPRQE